MYFLLDLSKVFMRLGSLPASTQKVLKVIHGCRIAGQKTLVL
jgi:hypothetical protein